MQTPTGRFFLNSLRWGLCEMFYSDRAGFTLEKINDEQKEISLSDWQKLIIGQSEGKIIGPDKNGFPVLNDPPPLTQEQLISVAGETKSSLMDEASRMIAPLEDAQKLGMASAAEAASLADWQKYRVLLFRVDTSKAPNIIWPAKPE